MIRSGPDMNNCLGTSIDVYNDCLAIRCQKRVWFRFSTSFEKGGLVGDLEELVIGHFRGLAEGKYGQSIGGVVV